MNEEELSRQIQTLQELKKQNKDVDVSALALAALQNQSVAANQLTAGEKRWAYLIAVALPPFGLFFAAKFYFSEKTDGRQAAYICLALTIVAIILLVIVNKMLFSSLGGALDQTQQIKPGDLEGLF